MIIGHLHAADADAPRCPWLNCSIWWLFYDRKEAVICWTKQAKNLKRPRDIRCSSWILLVNYKRHLDEESSVRWDWKEEGSPA